MEIEELQNKVAELEAKNKELAENLSKQRTSYENKLKDLETKEKEEEKKDVSKLGDEEFAKEVLGIDEDELEEMTDRELKLARKEWELDQKIKEVDEKVAGVETKVVEKDLTEKALELADGDEEMAEKILFTAKEKFGDLTGKENVEELLSDSKVLVSTATGDQNNIDGKPPVKSGSSELGSNIKETMESLNQDDGGLTPDKL